MVGTTNDNVVPTGYAGHVQGPIIEANVVIGVGASPLPAGGSAPGRREEPGRL